MGGRGFGGWRSGARHRLGRWLALAAAAGWLAAPYSAALAEDVDVTANTTAGVNLNAMVGNTVRVYPGVTVGNNSTLMPNNSFPSFFASTQAWTLTNQGTIDGLLGNAVTFNAGGTVNNEGQITDTVLFGAGGTFNNAAGASLGGAPNAVTVNGGAGVVTNSGTVTSTSTTISLNAGGIVTNNFGGTIENTGCCNAVSVRGGTSRQVVNEGTIAATNGAFDAGVVIANGTVTNGATGVINGRYNAIWATSAGPSIINNAGTLTAQDDGGIELDAGGTVVNSGTIEGVWGINFFGAGGTTSVTNSGTIVGTGGTAILFAGANDSVTLLPTSAITGAINGGGGTDTFTLSGTAGTLATFNASTNTVSNFETATKTGAGTWNLAGNAAFIPIFDVQQGRLNVNGTFAALDLVVQSGATLGGTGTFDSFNALAGSTIAPGNSIGTMTVATATFAPGSIFEVEVNPTTSDLLNVTGTATINPGATVNVVPAIGVYTVGTEYLILDAGTRAGTFSGITDTSAFLEFVLDHAKDPNEVWLRVASVANFPLVAQTPNQLATAQALQNLGFNSPLGMAVAPLSAADALVAFDQLSGEIHASAGRVLIEDSRIPREAALDRVSAAFDAIEQMREEAWGRHLWARFVGSVGLITGDGNAAPLHHGAAGLIAGADGLVADNVFLGFEAGVTRHGFSAPDRNSTGSATGYHLGVYGGVELDPLLLKFGASITGYGVNTVRSPTFPGFTDTAKASYTAGTAQVFAELSHAIELDEVTLEPFLRLAVVRHASSSYAETGGASVLNGSLDGNLSAIVRLGLYGSADLILGDGMIVEARGMIGVEHHAGATPTATHAFAGGSPFMVAAAGFGTGPVAELGIGVALSETTSLNLSLKGGLGGSGGYGAATATFSGTF